MRTSDVNEWSPSSANRDSPKAVFLNQSRIFVLADFMLRRNLFDLAVYGLHTILNRRKSISNPARLLTELIPSIRYLHATIGYACHS